MRHKTRGRANLREDIALSQPCLEWRALIGGNRRKDYIGCLRQDFNRGYFSQASRQAQGIVVIDL